MEQCVVCKNEVLDDDKALECDLCEKWEHVTCVRAVDRPQEAMYQALIDNRSKAIMYVCSQCRKPGSVSKRLLKYDCELERAEDERLASARALDEAREELVKVEAQYREDKCRMQEEITELRKLLQTLGHSGGGIKVEPREGPPPPVTATVTETSSSDDESSHGGAQTEFRQPPAFKELRSRLDKFTGKTGDGDFELWLDDFQEVTEHCGWTNEQRAHWFSWFIAGPAKVTWQRTLTTEDKCSWEKIKAAYQAQYGIHIDPRTAYQRCHELQYDQFNSVQGLMTAMRDYQRMAPTRLTDSVLESILWNKVPISLQRELKEITMGSVQELLQKLLRAESVVQEHDRRLRKEREASASTPRTTRNGGAEKSESAQVRMASNTHADHKKANTNKLDSSPEMGQKKVKCFKCSKRGHIASNCPVGRREPSTLVVTTGTNGESTDPWVLQLTAEGDSASPSNTSVSLKGPAYKAIVQAEGIRTRALVDFGAQVTLVRRQMLPKIKEKQGWSIDQCHARNRTIEQQPVGAGGKPLGAESVVSLNIQVEATGVTKEVLCYVLDSDKPLWKGELTDCGVVLGTNCLESLGFKIIHSDGSAVGSGTSDKTKEIVSTKEATMGSAANTVEEQQPDTGKNEGKTGSNTQGSPEVVCHVSLSCNLRLGPQQTKMVKVQVDSQLSPQVLQLGRLCPSSELENRQCDFLEGLWEGDKNLEVSVTNWGQESVFVSKDTVIGTLQEVELVTLEDPVWKDQWKPLVATVNADREQYKRSKTLQEKLVIGECNAKDRAALLEVILANFNTFALSDGELGETNLVEHEIKLTDSMPITAQPRRLPYALRTKLEEELERLLSAGCIEPSTSPYSSGLVLVRKKDGGLRVCVDYRAINKITVPDQYPMPRIDELIDTVGRCKGRYFSSLDLMKGYHQVKMADRSKEKTAFTCHQGLFQYRRMPFGLTNAPATFQRLMTTLFAGKEWNFVFIYLDDLLIVSKSITEHMEHLKRVLIRLGEANLKLKPEKCRFLQQRIEYLGHTLTADGVCPNDGKIRAMKEFPRPRTVKEVKSFLGLVNYYRRHLQNLATVARPLTALTRKGKFPNQVEWTSECEEAFTKVKEMLVTAPMLCHPDLSKPFFLSTDACERGFGAVLEQEGEDQKRYPIAYASRQTNPAEQKYAPTEPEVAALVFAVTHFEVYLLGNKVTVYTDHQALVSAFVSHLKSQTRGLLARWYLKLSRFLPQLELKYKPGCQNTAADALSRAPVENCDVRTVAASDGQEKVLIRVQAEQRKDSELFHLINYLEGKGLPEDMTEAKKVVSAANRGYFLVDGVLYYESTDTPGRKRLVVPQHLRKAVLDEGHDPVYAGHFSAKKLVQKLSIMYHWPGMRGDAYQKCASCVLCASTQGQGRRTKPPLHSIPVNGPFYCIGMDFKEFDLSKRGNRYALVFQDYMTKWPEVYAVADRKATTVAHCLADFIWKHGVPVEIIHDRAAEFLSDILQETAQVLGVTQLPTSGGHPQTDGLVERLNRTLKQMLSKIVSRGGRDWDDLLGPVLFAYRTAPHSSTGETPFSLVYGRDARVPTNLDFYQPVQKMPVVESEFARELFEDLKYARKLAQQNIKKAQKQQKDSYDRATKEPTIKVNDLVMLKVEPRFKLDRTYRGPYRVLEVTATNVVIRPIHDPQAESWNVSLQRISKCSGELSSSTPWLGHCRNRKRRTIKKKVTVEASQPQGEQTKVVPGTTTTRRGWKITLYQPDIVR